MLGRYSSAGTEQAARFRTVDFMRKDRAGDGSWGLSVHSYFEGVGLGESFRK